MSTPDDERPRGTPAVWTLVILNALVALSMASIGVSPLLTSADALVAFGALSSREAWAGEVWRLFTALFVHGGIWHVGLNMWVLAQVGRALETAIGTSRFALVYFVSGVFGFALSLLVHPGITAGASGAVFGVTGGLFGIALHTRGLAVGRAIITPLVPFVVGTLALGFLIPFVDNSAHVGGLIMGALLGFALSTDVRFRGVELNAARTERDKRLGLGALVGALVLFVIVVPLSLRPTFSPRHAVAMAQDALFRGSLDEAKDALARATALAPQDGAVLALTGRMRIAEVRSPRDDAEIRAARARAAPFFRESVRAFDEERADRALSAAMLAFGRGPDPKKFVIGDDETTRGLCEAALERTADAPIPEVFNNCAWFFVNVEPTSVDDVARARALAERAVALLLGARDPTTLSSLEKASAAAYLHTLAEARLRAGDAEEARATLERIVAQGLSNDAFYEVELDRVRRAATREARPSKPRALEAQSAGEVHTRGDAGVPDEP